MSSRKKAPKRRLLPEIVFAFTCVVLTGLLLKHFLGVLPPKTSSPVANQSAPSSPTTNGTSTSHSVMNQPEALDPEDRVVALVTEGNQLLAQGDYAAAAKGYKQAVAISPDQEDLHYNLAIALAKLGKTAEAKKHYEEALRSFPEYAEAHNNLRNLLMNENKLEEAIGCFREAIKNMPGNASFHNNLGTAFGRQGKMAEAIGEFEEAVKQSPAYVEARVNLGNGFLATGRMEEAIVQLNEALRLKPDFQPALQAMQRARQLQGSSQTQNS